MKLGAAVGVALSVALLLSFLLDDSGAPKAALVVGLIAILVSLVDLVIHLRGIEVGLEELQRGAESLGRGEFGFKPDRERVRLVRPLARALRKAASFLMRSIVSLEERRREEEAIFLSLREGVALIDAEERVLKLNEAAARLNGVDPASAIGRSVVEVFRNVDLLRFVRRVMEEREPSEAAILLHGESERSLRVYARLVEREGEVEPAVLVVLHDVTELERLEAVRREFLANVSHEMRTPMTSIQGSAETLLEGALEDPVARRSFIEMISRQARRLGELFDDLLTLSRLELEAERGEMTRERLPLRPLFEEACQPYRARGAAKGVALEIRCPQELVVEVNDGLFQQAVGNLVDNAVKYAKEGTRVSVEASLDAEGRLVVEVADEGMGIPEAHHSRLFERFYRVDKGRGRMEGGTGLGLAIVKHICQAHDGSVSVSSAPGKGAKFSIRLPTGG